MEEQRIQPSGWFYALGLAVLVFGCMAAIALFAVGMAGTAASAVDVDRLIHSFDRVVVPGSTELTLDETGPYLVFYEHRSVVDGVTYNTSRSRPRLNCELQNKASGREVTLNDAWLGDSNYQLPDRSGALLMRFDVDRPGVYRLSCRYAGGQEAPKTVLAIGTDLLPSAMGLATGLLAGLLGPVLLTCGAALLAGLIVIVVAVLRHQSARRIADQAG
jgi:hypothetical protein